MVLRRVVWLPLLLAGCVACASTENPQSVVVINGGTGGSGAAGGSAGASGASGGVGATGGSASMGGSGATAGAGGSGAMGGVGGATGGTAGLASGGAAGGAGVGGSAAVGGSAGTAGNQSGGAGGSGGAGAVNLFFSEYMEDGQNKGVEIYNAGAPIDLSMCVLRVYFNGSSTATPDIQLDSKTLENDQVHTVCGTDTAAGGLCQQVATNKLIHSGDDAIELVCNGTTLDVIGIIGSDPGSGWSGGGISTNDQTLWRKCSVTKGNPNGFSDPSIEWESPTSGAKLDYSNFGQKSCP